MLYAEAKFNDPRLLRYPEAIEWAKDADTNGESAYNIGVLYQQILHDNAKAIEWYKKAYRMDDVGAAGDACINLGNIYKKQQRYDDAIFYYKKAYNLGNTSAANGLGYLYHYTYKDLQEAKIWYKKAIKSNNIKAIGNLAKLYHQQNKNELGAAYLISLIDNGYSKTKVIKYLKTKWHLTDKEIKQAYRLQKTLDIPKHYYDPEFE